MRRLKCQALSRSMIEPLHDVVTCASDIFGHILANQPVGVLVESALPSMVGMGKITAASNAWLIVVMVGKLRHYRP